MDRTVTWGALAACAGLAGCLNNAGDALDIVPVAEMLDAALPFGATDGVEVTMLSADFNGVSDIDATITFNADQTLTITLPGGRSVTIADAFTGTVGPDADLLTTTASYFDGIYDVDVHLGEDTAGSDLFILARIDDSNTPANPVTFVVFGDETAALPTGNAVAYTGGFVSDVFDAVGTPVSQMSGDTTITANFGAGNVDVVFSQTGEVANATFTGTNILMNGARYEGDITSSGGGTNYVGRVVGAFYGPGAEATAGAFNAEDASGGAGNELIIVGGYTGFAPTP